VDIVGSTSTLVSERIEQAGLSAPPELAGMLLAGLLSDTLILTSPTTTERDRQAAERLGAGLLSAAACWGETDPVLWAEGAGCQRRAGHARAEGCGQLDMKVYSAGGYHFAIAQAEVSDLYEVSERLDILNNGAE
jgi:manganese-dependent inorganic pyrophosphatase